MSCHYSSINLSLSSQHPAIILPLSCHCSGHCSVIFLVTILSPAISLPVTLTVLLLPCYHHVTFLPVLSLCHCPGTVLLLSCHCSCHSPPLFCHRPVIGLWPPCHCPDTCYSLVLIRPLISAWSFLCKSTSWTHAQKLPSMWRYMKYVVCEVSFNIICSFALWKL